MDQQVFDGLFGIENEFAIAAFDEHGARVPESMAVKHVFQRLKGLLPFLPAHDGGGIFVSNGGRIYIDQEKLEICTPEVNHPDDLCRYVRAGERIIWQAAEDLKASGEFSAVSISRCQVSYGSNSSHGFHESYSTKMPVPAIVPTLHGHLASRIIYTGSGGFDCFHPGLQFVLSPRLACMVTRGRRRSRMRDTGLAMERRKLGNRHRLHLASAEGLASDRMLWFLVATTAAIVAALNAGARFPRWLKLREPQAALRRINQDPTLASKIAMESGRNRTALELQQAYLAVIERYQNHPQMPSWTPLLCHLWNELLEQLSTELNSVCDTIDWIAKKHLFQQHAAKQGIVWDELAKWFPSSDRERAASIAQESQCEFPWGGWLDGFMRPREMTSTGLPQNQRLIALRHELCEIDYRLGELSEEGLFHVLQEDGVVNHRRFNMAEVEQAIYEPPQAVKRARIRGNAVKKYAESPQQYRVKWSQISDCAGHRFIDLTDERTATEQWQSEGVSQLPTASRQGVRQSEPRPSLETLMAEYRQGHFANSSRSLAALAEENITSPQLLQRTQAWLNTRTGQLGGKELLEQLQVSGQIPLWYINDHLFVHRFGRIKPDVAGMERWIQQGESLVEERIHRSYSRQMAVFREHQLAYLFANHKPQEAYEGLKTLLASDQQIPHRVRGRAMALLGTIAHRLERISEAQRWFRLAEQLQRSIDARTDLNEFTRPWIALLEESQTGICEKLEAASRENLAMENRSGEARSIVLLARHCSDDSLLEAIRERLDFLLANTPLLASCSHMQFILAHWEAWQFDRAELDEMKDWYWGV